MSRRGEVVLFVPAVITGAALLLGGGKTLLQGEDAKLHDDSTQLQAQSAHLRVSISVIDARAPRETLLFVPFALFSCPAAFRPWLGANILLSGIRVFLLRRWFLRPSTRRPPLSPEAVRVRRRVLGTGR